MVLAYQEGDVLDDGVEVVRGKKQKYLWAHSDFGNLIAKRESNNDYNICNKTKGGYKVVRDIKVVNLSIKKIQQKQKDRDVFAVGRYQLIPITLNAAVKFLNLDINKKLDEEMQDRIFEEYLIKIKRPEILKYLESKGSVEDAMYSSAKEWASIGVQKGKKISERRIAKGGESYYVGDGLNKAHITPDEIKQALVQSRSKKSFYESILKNDQSNSDRKVYSIGKAVKKLKDKSKSSPIGACGRYVRYALEAGFELKQDELRGITPVAAKNFGSFLIKKEFHKLQIVDLDSYRPLKGDVAVFVDFQGLKKYHKYGHVQMYDGKDWISDFVQRGFWAGDDYRVKKPSFVIYRW